MKKILISLLFLLSIMNLFPGQLKVAAVQLEINDETYSSYEQFQREMEEEVRKAMTTFDPDLIIFPEYTSVFPGVTPYYDLINSSFSIEEIFYKIHNRNSNIQTLKDLFVEQSPAVNQMLAFWGDLAKEYSVTIIGGTYFAKDGDELRNRLIVFGPSGERIYEQDKYFLTDFETEIVNLSRGSAMDPAGFTINEKDIVMTICRDTFLKRWESMYDGADLWIDIKANGEVFGPDQVALFSRALPARMKDSSVPYGVTVCLTGTFLELFWEGESSLVKKIDNSVHTIINTRDPRHRDQLYFVVE